MIAEVVPQAEDLATKADIARLEARIDRLDAAVQAQIDRLGRAFSDRMLRYFVPLWVAVFGALGTMIALIAAR